MTILLIVLSAFLLYLIHERADLNRLRKSIPLVISVTGTRGKSTVVRLLASVLRESGRVVLAKSTGSQAQYVLPDGTVENVRRRGIVSILEQKKVLRKAAMLHADCLVVEIMSIRPENHVVESQHVLKPDLVLLTNVRRDHTEAMGEKEEDVARVLELDLPIGAEVYVAQECQHYLDPRAIESRSLRVKAVQQGKILPSGSEFEENLDLIAAVAGALNIDDGVMVRGIQKASYDIGKFRIWSLRVDDKRIYLVNGFAANDPESTSRVLKKTREALGEKAPAFTGLLNLRADRPDRTMQWIETLNSGMSTQFARIYVLGSHANVVRRKVNMAQAVAGKRPEEITQSIASGMEKDGVLFGFGNIGGAGRQLVEYWQRKGEEHGI